MIRFVIGIFLLLMVFGRSFGQTAGLRTNVLYLATTTPNVGLDVRVGPRSTLTAFVGYNPFRFSNRSVAQTASTPKLLHWLGMAEYKYWLCRAYEQWFVGAFGGYTDFNLGGISFIDMLKANRYDGYAAGGGISAGYQWAFSRRWGLECSAGLGYAYIRYAKHSLDPCVPPLKQAVRHWVGPLKLSLSVIYYIQ